MVAELGLSQDQQMKLDNMMQQNRLKLIDLNASLQKEKATLEPLVSADVPDETKITGQIDRVAQASGTGEIACEDAAGNAACADSRPVEQVESDAWREHEYEAARYGIYARAYATHTASSTSSTALGCLRSEEKRLNVMG